MTPFQPLVLPNGGVIPNRIAKAAMEENMAAGDHAPSGNLIRLYRSWAEGGAGLLLTGNVMIDRRALTGPGGVVLEDDTRLDAFERWARTARSGGAQVWVQLNHPGRQVRKAMGQDAWAPSAVALDLGKHSNLFPMPVPMTEENIEEMIARFATSAALAERAGFTGVQIHAAHGYLLSQFLSPLTNRRTDRWGGSLDNRARIVIEVVKAVRAVVSPGFCVAVKLNSADFQRGGFDAADAKAVVDRLGQLPIDLVELSGGSYEAPAMQGQTRDGRTLAREAYFLEFARDIVSTAQMPIMITGGIRRLAVVEQVLDSGVAMAGIGTALAIHPALPNAWRNGLTPDADLPAIAWKSKPLAALARMAVVKFQLRRLSQGRATRPGVSPLMALLFGQLRTGVQTRAYRAWMRRARITEARSG